MLKTNFYIGSFILFISSLFFYEYGKALLSISMFGLFFASMIEVPFKTHIKDFCNNKSLLVLSCSFLVLLLFVLNSSNLYYYIERLQIKVPLLILPFAFAGLINLNKRVYNGLLYLFVAIAACVALITMVHYFFNIDAINNSYLKAKVMPSILNHVRLSIMIAMGAYIAFYLYRTDYIFKYKIEKWVLLSISILLFVFVHVYSVRSGLMALYTSVAIEIGYYIYLSKNYRKAIFIFIVFIATLLLSIQLVPTLHNKWKNTKDDYSIYMSNGYPNYNSLTTRFISYEAARFIFKESPVFGCGLGDIKDKTDAYFKEKYPMIDIPILPHNQFLFYLASTGIVGLLLFCLTFFFPLFIKRNWTNKILIVHYVILFVSFQTEPMLETQLGIAYSLLFILLPLTQVDIKDE